MKNQLYPALAGSIGFVLDNFSAPDANRQKQLIALADYLRNHPKNRDVIFVCTHNSRRSHLSQYWSAAAAVYYNIDEFRSYSGGTEATALHPNTIDALRECSFEIRLTEEHETNPKYEVNLGGSIPRLEGFSKKIGESPNPTKDFCAVMVCSDADEGCPFVPGATTRISLPFEDPKSSDGTPEQAKTYHRRSLEIAREMLWTFEQLA